MAQPSNDYVDMSKIQFYSYAFHFFFAAAKSSLLPFLAIYLRSLGMTAPQIGIIIGVASWITMFSSTCWTSCGTHCNKRRFVLVGSVLALIISYLALMVVPPISDQTAVEYCNRTTELSSADFDGTVAMINDTTHKNVTANSTSTIQSTSPVTTTLAATVAAKISEPEEQKTTTTTTTSTTTTTTTTTTTSPEVVASTAKESDSKTVEENEEQSNKVNNDDLNTLTDDDLELLKSVDLSVDDLIGLSSTDIEDLLGGIIADLQTGKNGQSTPHPTRKTIHHRPQRDTGEDKQDKQEPVEETGTIESENTDQDSSDSPSLMNSVWEKINQIQAQLKELRNQLFAVVMVILIVARLFGSPADKMSDDAWFDFLDGAEMLEKYGQHRSWASLGVLIFPIITTGLVVHSPCLLFGSMINTKIHFLMFGGLMLLCFILSFMYPMYQNARKVQRKTRLSRGFRILFSECHAVMYTLTIIIVGMLESLIFNFLFWHVQDLNGSELVMGSALSMAAFSQILMYIFHKWLLRALSYGGAMTVGLLILGARLLLYSFIWSPWLIMIGEAFHGLSSTLIWCTVFNYPDFRLNPFVMDRSALTVLIGLHTGFGTAAGSILSGYMLDMFGLRRVFQGGCILIVAWVTIFVCSLRCVKKKAKIRYAKLLQDDNSESDEESVSFDENDWLEIALKHQK